MKSITGFLVSLSIAFMGLFASSASANPLHNHIQEYVQYLNETYQEEVDVLDENQETVRELQQLHWYLDQGVEPEEPLLQLICIRSVCGGGPTTGGGEI